jgi:hypothetical protein
MEFIEVELPNGQIIEAPANMPKDVLRGHLMAKFPNLFPKAGPPEKNELGNTLAITAGGFQKGAREGGNPLGLLKSMAQAVEPTLEAMPLQSAALRALGVRPGGLENDQSGNPAVMAGGIERWANRNAPAVDPGLFWNSPQGQFTNQAFKSVTGLDAGRDLATPQAAAKATGAEMTPLRRALASAAEIAAGQIPYLATGPVGAGVKLAGASAALGGFGDLVGGETGKTIGSLAALPLALRSKPTGPKPSPAPSGDDLAATVKQSYKAAEDAGVVFKQEALQDLSKSVNAKMAAEGLTEGLHPAALAATKRLEAEAARGPMTFEGADKVRQVFNRYLGSAANKDDRRLLYMIRDELDGLINNPSAASVLMGDARAASDAILKGRSAYSRMSLSNDIEAMIEKAKIKSVNYGASGFENALRREFVKFAANERRMRMVPEYVQDAIKKVAAGGTMDNILRSVGKFTPKGVISGALHGASIVSNPAIGIPLAGVTMAARVGATKATLRNARLAAELARRGAPIPPQLRKYLNAGAVPGAIGARSSEQ